MAEDIRWEQRFMNYKKALARLQAVQANELPSLSELEKEGLIQRFEYTYELAWKTLQDFLRYKGYIDFAGPNATLSLALQDGYITDADGWRKMKKSRELMSHTYDEGQADQIVSDIAGTFVHLLEQLCIRLTNELDQKQLNLF
ncbi:nucleotidyltransferase substrate binding protein [Parabacteroides acidifaciens]|uniref:Nucleotidyltransferase n=1 Tax=Parabacteroides acidifaciens TaxID=2290935 RepID=A0A3D8HHQ6_9BACT|nr:nucleotidyltransferase substrate binding protein [Parabacteroides acidifaciens]MBC8600781.1 nucleotidyltransferase substrate binding protein [Parabacteroides acidifaciens]RDU50509.1 nucleotidyltransferase [Parabacteroides acidifaciens]